MQSKLTNMYLEEVLQDTHNRANGIDVKVTGFGWWKRVVVPPNVYVVHTRAGHKEPINVGLGLSFRYNPNKDAFLVIPATMQTILINAKCICRDRQGILVQAYVQWLIDNIEIAYRRLDFSDSHDPTRIVNEQLREQAEAAIKDKVSTMGIDEVLSDKQAIMEDLTTRLRGVVEGSDSGLGLKIVTVQLKEAVVSSARLWENLQKPFRSEKAQMARLAEIASEQAIRTQETEDRKVSEIAELEVQQRLSQLRHESEAEAFDRRTSETQRRYKAEEEAKRKQLLEAEETERLRLQSEQETTLLRKEKELELETREAELKLQHIEAQLQKLVAQASLDEAQDKETLAHLERSLARQEQEQDANHRWEQLRLEREQRQSEIDNTITPARIQEQLVALLPSLAASLPQHAEIQRVHISSQGDTPDTWSSLLGLASALRSLLDPKPPPNTHNAHNTLTNLTPPSND